MTNYTISRLSVNRTPYLAGLRYNKGIVARLLREDIMKESVTYQAILEEGVEKGLERGKQLGERALVARQLTRRVGKVDARLRKRLEKLSSLQLGDLGEALLEFESREDLSRWLRHHETKS